VKKKAPSMLCPRCGGAGRIPLQGAGFRDVLLAARTEARMTQEELSQKSGFSRAQIANLENGRGSPSWDGLKRLSEALGCSMKDLVP